MGIAYITFLTRITLFSAHNLGPVGCAEPADEFWDYEKQVDLEAFSTNTFYNLLLKQSLSVTSRLGQLTTEVSIQRTHMHTHTHASKHARTHAHTHTHTHTRTTHH